MQTVASSHLSVGMTIAPLKVKLRPLWRFTTSRNLIRDLDEPKHGLPVVDKLLVAWVKAARHFEREWCHGRSDAAQTARRV